MNITDAVKRALDGEWLKDGDNGEMLTVCSSGTGLRYASTRQVATVSIKNILSEDWQCESDFVRISIPTLRKLLSADLPVERVDEIIKIIT